MTGIGSNSPETRAKATFGPSRGQHSASASVMRHAAGQGGLAAAPSIAALVEWWPGEDEKSRSALTRDRQIVGGERPGVGEAAKRPEFLIAFEIVSPFEACGVDRIEIGHQQTLLRLLMRRQLGQIPASDIDLVERRRLDVIERRPRQ